MYQFPNSNTNDAFLCTIELGSLSNGYLFNLMNIYFLDIGVHVPHFLQFLKGLSMDFNDMPKGVTMLVWIII